jgi:hypothetical protein
MSRKHAPRSNKPVCPKCGSNNVLRIAYGLPTPKGEFDALAGKVILGGCMVEPGQPDRHCKECKHSWRNEGEPGVVARLMRKKTGILRKSATAKRHRPVK